MITTATAPLSPSPDLEIEHVALDEDYVLTPAFVAKVVDAADDGDGPKLRSLLEDLHPADVADLMGFLTSEHRAVVVLWLPPELLADTLPELDDGIREEVLERVPHLVLAKRCKSWSPTTLRRWSRTSRTTSASACWPPCLTLTGPPSRTVWATQRTLRAD